MITSTQSLTLGNVETRERPRQILKGMAKHKNKRTSQESKAADPVYLTFEENLIKRNDLVSFDVDEEKKKGETKQKKIISYISNRDTLSIPVPERTKRPVDISKNLIEEKIDVPIADLGIQSDEINYENPERPYVPQKIGKDTGTQVEDGELFNFDRDVQPLLTVLTGKTLEQSLLEISQEEEIKTLLKEKENYMQKLKKEKIRIKEMEEKEINRKIELDNIKKLRKVERNIIISTQKKLTSRVFAKCYLNMFTSNTMKEIINKNLFNDTTNAFIKTRMNEIIFNKIEIERDLNDKVSHAVTEVKIKNHERCLNQHHFAVKKKKDEVERKRIEAEQERIREEERAKIEKEERVKRRRERKINRIKNEIKTQIIDTAQIVPDVLNEEISEIDNYKQDTSFIGVYGGLIGTFVLSLSIMKKHIFTQENLMNEENIIDIISLYLNECNSPLNILLNDVDNQIENELKDKIEIENLDISNLKTIEELTPENWEIIGQDLANLDLISDYILKDMINTVGDKETNLSIYSMIIQCLCRMLANNSHLEKINFKFKRLTHVDESSLEDKVKNYEAFCQLDLNEDPIELIETVDYTRHNTKKKAIRAPEFDDEIKSGRLYTRTPEHNVLIYDRVAEFVIRNKIFECAIRILNNEVETKSIFKRCNELYEHYISTSKIFDLIQFYSYKNVLNTST